ncbi:MOSC domain-containing protein [Gracilibacillus oryzae]|uniref:MOSC domain-containing protein n=1 Tax=Gracilibacillus oryzae TaxID=1672701 RepID=A0A7C8KQU2_9BACI|nr:MOSC domain-containing protein [Gracilibacillus oryzae]KAB8129350.1 MOSC domain-containing protein [Gracilibacillus oryzae]
MIYEVISLNVGKPQTYKFGEQILHTGFVKKPAKDACFLTKTGFKEDGQADLKNHGGEEKALLMYSEDHYPYWKNLYKQNFTYPAFGENITVKGLTEKELYIGDVFKIGEAVIQVAQPRQPCYKIAVYHQLKDITAVVTNTGYSGYYFRVLQEGEVSNSDKLEKIEESYVKVTPFDIFECLFHDRENRDRMEEYRSIPALSANVKNTLSKRIRKLGG